MSSGKAPSCALGTQPIAYARGHRWRLGEPGGRTGRRYAPRQCCQWPPQGRGPPVVGERERGSRRRRGPRRTACRQTICEARGRSRCMHLQQGKQLRRLWVSGTHCIYKLHSPDHVVLGIRSVEVRLAQREVCADLVILHFTAPHACHKYLLAHHLRACLEGGTLRSNERRRTNAIRPGRGFGHRLTSTCTKGMRRSS